jgi:DNA-directed RNA polymerase subunit beta
VIPRPGIPESFKVLVRELQSLGLDVSVHKLETKSDGSSKDVEVDLMADVLNLSLDINMLDAPGP